jgi:hypothetical protein
MVTIPSIVVPHFIDSRGTKIPLFFKDEDHYRRLKSAFHDVACRFVTDRGKLLVDSNPWETSFYELFTLISFLHALDGEVYTWEDAILCGIYHEGLPLPDHIVERGEREVIRRGFHILFWGKKLDFDPYLAEVMKRFKASWMYNRCSLLELRRSVFREPYRRFLSVLDAFGLKESEIMDWK